VENVTYRWKGHSKSDKNLYRTREEIAAWQERDPITRFEDAVRKAGSLTDAEITAARKSATDAVREAIRTANAAAPAPADRDLLLDAVYADGSAEESVEVSA
jgi:acetoin:2,6-dichlorophenolindophenol oxidoreductase subunit alpha